ncbi:MAG: hypothetical protein ABEK50_05225, partial [bacterium]
GPPREDPPGIGAVRVITDTPEDTSIETIKDRQSRGASLTGDVLTGILSHLLES